MENYKFSPGSPRHGQMDIKGRFSLWEFAEVFNVRNSEGLPYVLIGGQAVNYWAERYFQTESELKALQPFTSEDIDFKGGKQDVKRIAEQLQLTEVYPSKVAMTALAGCVPFQIGDLKSNIEIIRTVSGISGSIDALAIEAELACIFAGVSAASRTKRIAGQRLARGGESIRFREYHPQRRFRSCARRIRAKRPFHLRLAFNDKCRFFGKI